VSGKKVFEMRITYTLQTQDSLSYKCQSRMILWTRDKYMYQIGIGLPQKADKGLLATIDGILKTVKIQE
jgi:hypothetical protein